MELRAPYRFSQSTRTDKEQDYASQAEAFFYECEYSGFEQMQNFPLFTSRQDITRYLAKAELFKKVLHVQGSIVECGVLFGGGLLWWGHLSSIYEPVNFQRTIIGFDTFSGHASLSDADRDSESEEAKDNGLAVDSYATIKRAVELYNMNRPIGHREKIEIIKGDACATIPEYLDENPQLVVSLLYLDFDVELPTVTALKELVPRMPRGAVIGFDELNLKAWKGEGQAVIEYFQSLNFLRIERFPWASTISYATIGE